MSSICVIIPTYNRASMIRECIDSILAQTHPVDKIVVVNDGSTDETQTVVQSYGGRIQLINKPNGGKSSAVNLALRQCKEDYVWICDDDDIAEPNAAAHLMAALDANPHAGFAFGPHRIFHDEAGGRVYASPGYWLREGEPNIHIQFLEGLFAFQNAILVRRSIYEQVGPFREDLIRSEDYEIMLRIARLTKGVQIPIIVFSQRQHQGLRGSANDKFSADQSWLKWLGYDQKIFSQIRREYQLEEFMPTFAKTWDATRAKRAALIQRACVFAKRALWDEAIADFLESATLSAAPASPEELHLAEAIVTRLLPWKILSEHKGWITALHACYQENTYSQQIIFAFCRPLVWYVRKLLQNGEFKGGLRILYTIIGILGLRGASSRILVSLFG